MNRDEPNIFADLRDSLPIIFWPIFFLSLRRLDTYRIAMEAEGYVGCDWKMTWYGYVYVTRLYRADPLAVLHELPTWEDLVGWSDTGLEPGEVHHWHVTQSPDRWTSLTLTPPYGFGAKRTLIPP